MPLFIFNRIYPIQPPVSVKGNAVLNLIELNDIAYSAYPHRSGMDGHSPAGNQIISFFMKIGVMGPFMEQLAYNSMFVFLPLLLNVDKGPLPPAKSKVLYARKHQIFVFPVFHYNFLISSTVAGILSSCISKL